MNGKTIHQRLKAQAGTVKNNLNELYTLALISFALPALIYLYVDWKAAVTGFVLIQIALGILRERK